MAAICSFIDQTPYLSDLQKQFYKLYLQARYELILQPAHEKLQAARGDQAKDVSLEEKIKSAESRKTPELSNKLNKGNNNLVL